MTFSSLPMTWAAFMSSRRALSPWAMPIGLLDGVYSVPSSLQPRHLTGSCSGGAAAGGYPLPVVYGCFGMIIAGAWPCRPLVQNAPASSRTVPGVVRCGKEYEPFHRRGALLGITRSCPPHHHGQQRRSLDFCRAATATTRGSLALGATHERSVFSRGAAAAKSGADVGGGFSASAARSSVRQWR